MSVGSKTSLYGQLKKISSKYIKVLFSYNELINLSYLMSPQNC